MEEIAVQFENVIYEYPGSEGVPAVNQISFSVKKGEFLSILGHNGSGKSTLARLVNGLLQADQGKITVLGMDIAEGKNVHEVRKHVGIVFQNPDNQMVASIVEDDIAFGPENIGVERSEMIERVNWALSAVGMSEYKEANPTRLSGGQKQRIAIAGVLAVKPDILILDESTAMLDPRGRREVINVVKKLNEEEGMTIILITHFMEEALLADRAIVMNRGEIVMEGTPEMIFEQGEQLECFNLALPKISMICKNLQSAGIAITPVLHPEELAEEIANYAEGKQLNPQQVTNVKRASVGGKWDIDIQNLTFTYSKRSPFATKALKGIDLKIAQGEFFGIIGHTGSGKSTLVQHLNALIKLPQAEKKYKKPKVKKGEVPPLEPQIQIGNYALADKKCKFKELRSHVGMVFQYPEYQLFAETVYDDVCFGLKNFLPEMTKEQMEERVRECIELVGLSYQEIKEKSPFDLSGGQKRRVAIAGVIVTKPDILILDEPAAGLDPLGKKEIMELLHKIHREWCSTVIIVSHDMDEVAENCSKVAVLSKGEVVFCQPPEELFQHVEELTNLGLDIPLAAKVCRSLNEKGIPLTCNYTCDDLTKQIITVLGGAHA